MPSLVLATRADAKPLVLDLGSLLDPICSQPGLVGG